MTEKENLARVASQPLSDAAELPQHATGPSAATLPEKHTPGPWSGGIDGNPRVYGPDGQYEHSGLVAVVYKGRANVRLISAAPDLLEALKRGHQKLITYGACYPGDKELHKTLIPMWEAAIAKAEGV